MRHREINTNTQAPHLETESGSIDYAAYDRLARRERADAFSATGRSIAARIRNFIERAVAMVTHGGHGAAAH